MKNNKILLFFLGLFLFIPFVIKAEEALDDYQKALLATADSFFNKGEYIQYGNERLTYLDTNNVMRSEIYFKPEEANEKNIFYTTCAQFAYMLYYNTFVNNNNESYRIKKNIIDPNDERKLGNTANPLINLANPSNSNYSSDIAVYYKEGVGESDINNVLSLSNLQVGDIILYRWNGTTAHAVVYYGNGTAIESYGAVYNFKTKTESYESNGTIRKVPLTEGTNNVKGRILTQAGRYTDTTVAVIRPLNEVRSNNYTTSDAKIRQKYRNLIIEGYPVNNRFEVNGFINLLKYKIKLKNVSSTPYKDVVVTIPIPEGARAEFKNDNVKLEDNKLIWTVDVNANSEVELQFGFSVKKYNEFVDGYFLVDTMRIDFPSVFLVKGDSIEYKYEVDKVVKQLEGNTFKDSIDYVNTIFKKVDGLDLVMDDINKINADLFTSSTLTTFPSSEAVTSAAYGNMDHQYNSQTVYTLKNTNNSKYKQMLINGLYGGIYTVDNSNNKLNNLKRLRYIKMNDFEVGDLLIVNNKDNGNVNDTDGEVHSLYIYTQESTFKTVVNNRITTIQQGDAERLVEKLIGQDNFYILKPSLLFDTEFNNFHGIEGNENNNDNNNQDNNQEKSKNPNTGASLSILGIIILIVVGYVIYLSSNKYRKMNRI